MIKKILIVIDDQMPDTSLVGRGLELSRQLGAEVGLIDVARMSIGFIEAGIYPADLEEIDLQRAEKTIEMITSQYPGIDFVDFEEVGDPVEEIKTVISEWNPDMLIVGHHKHSILQRLAENAKERRIINQLDIPVLVFPCDSE